MNTMLFNDLNEHDLNRLGVNIVYDALPNVLDGNTVSNKIKANDILGQNTPYDILWNDNKLCVRVANISTTSRFPKWNYTLKAENKAMVDFYVFLALREGKLFKIFVLPPLIIPETTITISERLGEVRYSMFVTELTKIPEKIEMVKKNLPEYKKLYNEAKI